MIFQKFIIFLFLSDFSKVCLFFPKTYNLTFWTHDHINLACPKFTWKVETKYFIFQNQTQEAIQSGTQSNTITDPKYILKSQNINCVTNKRDMNLAQKLKKETQILRKKARVITLSGHCAWIVSQKSCSHEVYKSTISQRWIYYARHVTVFPESNYSALPYSA